MRVIKTEHFDLREWTQIKTDPARCATSDDHAMLLLCEEQTVAKIPREIFQAQRSPGVS
jgi:hypothetical protein